MLVLATPALAADCNVPDCVGLGYNREQCINAIQAAGLVVGVEVNVPGIGQALRQVIAQNPPGLSVVDCCSAVDFDAVSYPIKQTSTFYANWWFRGRPACWAYPRQCNGDADGKKLLIYWVNNNDMSILRSSIGNLETAIPNIPMCADFDHKKQGAFRVSGNDLRILRANYLQLVVPICGNVQPPPNLDPDYHYWCLPPGGVCPPGQFCAPAGYCPNTP